MGKLSTEISNQHQLFIEKQQMFFVATAPLQPETHINLSPKGLSYLKVISPNSVAYMDFVGSGNETAAHLLENGRITFMFCSFDKVPNILRLYGKGQIVLPGSQEWEIYAPNFSIQKATRQIIVAEIDHVQTSCGYGVPLFEFQGTRSTLFEWADQKTEEDILDYIHKKNQISLDGFRVDTP